MWNENAGNEWRPKLECARLRLRLKEHARESIIFRESWPGKRFHDFRITVTSLEREYVSVEHIVKQKLRISLLLDCPRNKCICGSLLFLYMYFISS